MDIQLFTVKIFNVEHRISISFPSVKMVSLETCKYDQPVVTSMTHQTKMDSVELLQNVHEVLGQQF